MVKSIVPCYTHGIFDRCFGDDLNKQKVSAIQ